MASHASFAILGILVLQNGLDVGSLLLDAANNKSVCPQYHRVNETYQASYMETFYPHSWDYDTVATRINFQTQTRTRWKVIETCCPGYEPREKTGDAGECVPVCPGGCENGECDRPNVCRCNAGYESSVNESTGNGECSPHCESGCPGGTCVAPESCICGEGYASAKNGTSCEPLCTDVGAGGPHNCGHNAVCVLPDTCQCDDGYDPFEAFDTWLVHEQRTFYSSAVVCQPKCEPACGYNAQCVGPGNCACDHGYEDVGVSGCHPVCAQTCHNGFCNRPNECLCFEGYQPHGTLGSSVCEPVCPDHCVNGRCIEPNNCECLEGYEKLIAKTANGGKMSDNVCVPVCPGGCANGRCVAPGQCHCDPGYALAPIERNASTEIGLDEPIDSPRQRCAALCEPRCENGSICVAPNQCQSRSRPVTNFYGHPVDRTRIIDEATSCEEGAVLSRDEAGCACQYRYNGQTCREPFICAVVIPTDVISASRFAALRSVIFSEEVGTEKTSRNHREADRLSALSCNTECRISVLSNEIPREIRQSSENCFRIELQNATTGILSTLLGDAKPIAASNSENLLCFVDAKFGCRSIKTGAADGTIASTAGGVVGALILIALIATASICLMRRKIRNGRLLGGLSRRSGTTIECTGATDSPFHNDDGSHL